MSDLVNPYNRWPVTQGWTEGSHAIPGGGPAIDYGTPFGTVLLSPSDGRVSLSQGGPAGLMTTLILPNNRKIILCHGSDFLVRHGDRVEILQPLMRSGNSGRVYPAPNKWNPYAGSHLHTYGLFAGGARWNWTRDATTLGITAGGESKPIGNPDYTTEDEEDTMKVFGYIKPEDPKRTTYVEMDFAGGLWDEFVSDDPNYGRSVAVNWGGGAPMLSLGHRNALFEKFKVRWPQMAALVK